MLPTQHCNLRTPKLHLTHNSSLDKLAASNKHLPQLTQTTAVQGNNRHTGRRPQFRPKTASPAACSSTPNTHINPLGAPPLNHHVVHHPFSSSPTTCVMLEHDIHRSGPPAYTFPSISSHPGGPFFLPPPPPPPCCSAPQPPPAPAYAGCCPLLPPSPQPPPKPADESS